MLSTISFTRLGALDLAYELAHAALLEFETAGVLPGAIPVADLPVFSRPVRSHLPKDRSGPKIGQQVTILFVPMVNGTGARRECADQGVRPAAVLVAGVRYPASAAGGQPAALSRAYFGAAPDE
jgi:hypothetical protein